MKFDFRLRARNGFPSPQVLLATLACITLWPQLAISQEPANSQLDALQRVVEQQQAELFDLRRTVQQHGQELRRLPSIDSEFEQIDPAASNSPEFDPYYVFAEGEKAAAKKPADTGKDVGKDSAVQKKLDDLDKRMKKAEDTEKKRNDFPNAKLTGFTQLDSAWYSQDASNMATVGDAQDGTGFRRLRLAVKGNVAEFTAYQLEVDFATAGRPSFFDNFIDQGNIPIFGNVKVGQFCQPFSVDSLTGFRNLTFLERSLPFLAFVPFRRLAVQSSNTNEDESTAWAYSVYRSGGFNNAPLGDDRFGTDFGDIGGYAFSTRMTHLINYDDNSEGRYLWHVGGGYNYSMLGANDAIGSGATGNAGSPRPFYQARTSPEFGSLGYPELGNTFGSAVNNTPSFVDTGRYEANSFHLFGLETVKQHGPWGFQAEYMATVVDSVVGQVDYQGGYAQLAYRLTGEHRAYDKKSGTLTKLTPYTDFIPLKHDGIVGWGAWEIAARWSIVDLRNPTKLDGHYYNTATNTFTGTSKAGNGELNDATLGITWFMNTHTKLQFNWIHAMLDNSVRGFSDADLFVSRFQVDF